ncbi:MAG: hypothetical protein LBT53_07625 [Puniceicoccales bacterium]|nr:hypothetical protein [Puniceicoccales bacterium]
MPFAPRNVKAAGTVPTLDHSGFCRLLAGAFPAPSHQQATNRRANAFL